MTIAQLATELDQQITAKIELLEKIGAHAKQSTNPDEKIALKRDMYWIAIQLRPVLPLVYAQWPHYKELIEMLLKERNVS